MVTTAKLAKLVHDFDYDVIPPRGVEMAKAAVIDTLGVALLAYEEPTVQAAVRVLGKAGEGEARVWRTGEMRNMREAVFLNSLSIHCSDYDNGGSLGHPASVFLPPAIALAERYHLSGKKVMEAYAVAYEIGARMRSSMGDLQFGAGYHATSLIGCICSAALSAKLMGLDAEKIRMAMAIACSLSSGMLISFGTDAKPIQVARAAENGLLAAQLAAEGCGGEPNIFEDAKGFYFVYGQEEGSIKALTDNFAKPLALATERGHFKQWACCGGNYEINSLIQDLLAEQPIDVSEIDSVRICTSMTPPGPAFRIAPRTAMEGRFSINYNAASYLIDGKVDLDTFTEEKFNRPEVHALMDKMRVEWHPDCAGLPRRLQGESRFVTMDLYMRNGTVISRRMDAAKRYQLEASETYPKFADNARAVGLAEDKIEAAIAMVKTLEDCDDFNKLLDLMN